MVISKSARKHHARTRTHSGEFYQRLVNTLIRGEEPEDKQLADTINWQLRLGVEVKASDNGHPFRLSLPQHQRYGEVLEFPLSRFAYCLCAYRNRIWVSASERQKLRKRGYRAKVRTALGRLRRRHEQFQYLAANTKDLFLFDLEIIQALIRRARSIGRDAFAGYGRRYPVAVLTRRDLLRFTKTSFAREMRELGFDNPAKWKYSAKVVTVTVEIDGNKYTSEFLLHTILKRRLSPQIDALHTLPSAA